ncbi:two-component system, OmpR family, sensor histidine kinase MtrB [Micromonospora phaseoli]|uniref:histidine kinase n=1 Tax=Micromonospora phaseoli TaxID=1144548 RepID=A0A1H6UE27_9ACTN|nr:HAMP domain-containing sensor histidine kinase [Micromonospora phaseoli]PZV98929.1 two-component system sensor histidine kinase MtrB [Micromonospora phaseoli]GIJ76320.1 two-component sensor histidine kinase [Micromonospora phaseoli]SEI88914.1 two-component system, OmpR family, sensor histidine kinase MtrB [Micromonospora phaseoli]
MGRQTVRPGRLRRRLTIAFVLVAGISAGVLAGGSYLLLRQARYEASLHAAAADARYRLVLAGQFLPLTEQRRAELLTSFESSGRHVVLVSDQTWPSNPGYAPPLSDRLTTTVAAGQVGYERIDGSARLLVVGGRIPGSTAELYVITVENDVATGLEQLRNALTAGWVLVLVLAATVGHTLARRTLEPVGRASRAARAITEGLLATRLPVHGRDEFSNWAASFNEMAEALEAKIAALHRAQERERRFTADVAHELRTPVTALAAAASLLGEHLDQLPGDSRRAGELLVTDVVRLRRLVEDLMEISRLDAGQEAVAVAEVDAPALLRAIVAARGWRDRVEVGGEPLRLRTDPRRLERVLGNLIANAVRHGGGEVRVRVARAGDRVLFDVDDQGPGIPAEHLPRLFDRFHKVDPARSGGGSGLGLAIAQENARLLGGRLTVHSSPGTGTRFRLDLPYDGPHRAEPDLPDDGVGGSG